MPKRRSNSTDDQGEAKAVCLSAPSGSVDSLPQSFFEVGCVALAKALLGKVLVRQFEGEQLRARVVETEAYLGAEDKAAHSYGSKQTARNRAMFMPAGTAYVYNIYGMYQCLNVSSGGEGCAVLLRAAEPLDGLATMQRLRAAARKKATDKAFKTKDLCNGPSKLCQALHVTKELFDQSDMTARGDLYFEQAGLDIEPEEIVEKARIGVAYAQDWTDKPLRFYVSGSAYVSVL